MRIIDLQYYNSIGISEQKICCFLKIMSYLSNLVSDFVQEFI